MTGIKTLKTLMIIALATLAFAGCSSDDSSPAAPTANIPTPVDTAPPAAPTGLTAEFNIAKVAIEVTWDANTTDGDLAGYYLSRTADGVTTELTPWIHPHTSFLDDGAPAGLNLYSVCAVDAAGNRSACASVKLTVQPIQ